MFVGFHTRIYTIRLTLAELRTPYYAIFKLFVSYVFVTHIRSYVRILSPNHILCYLFHRHR